MSTASHATDVAIAAGTIFGALALLLTFGITAWTMWVNLYDRRRMLIDALGVWFEGGDAKDTGQDRQGQLHVNNEAPTPMRGVFVRIESFRRYGQFFSEADDLIVFPVSMRMIAPKQHCIMSVSLEPNSAPAPDNKHSNDTSFGLRVKEIVARDNSGRLWHVTYNLNKENRAKKKRRNASMIVENWRESTRHEGYNAPVEGPKEILHDQDWPTSALSAPTQRPLSTWAHRARAVLTRKSNAQS
jgi:hypothetical protein